MSATSDSAARRLHLQLAPVEEQLRLALRRHDGVAEHERRVRQVAAADVEQPGDRVERGDDDGVLLVARQLLLDRGDLVVRLDAGKGDRLQRDRLAAAAPGDRSRARQRIRLDRHQRGPGPLDASSAAP